MDNMLIDGIDTDKLIRDFIRMNTLKKYREMLNDRKTFMRLEDHSKDVDNIVEELYDNFTTETKSIIRSHYNTRKIKRQNKRIQLIMNRVWYLTYTQIAKAFIFPPNTTMDTKVCMLFDLPMRVRIKLGEREILTIADMVDFVNGGNLFTDIKGIEKPLHDKMMDTIAYYIPTITMLKLKYSRGNRSKTAKAVDDILKMVKDPNLLK